MRKSPNNDQPRGQWRKDSVAKGQAASDGGRRGRGRKEWCGFDLALPHERGQAIVYVCLSFCLYVHMCVCLYACKPQAHVPSWTLRCG